MILTQQLLLNSASFGGNLALRYLGKDTTFRELTTTVNRLSYLYQKELGVNARMAFFCQNSPAVVTTFLALSNLRVVSIPIHPDTPPDEITTLLKESKATHCAVTSDLLAKLREIFQGQRITLPIVEIEKKRGGEYDTSFTPLPEQVPVETDPILFLKTSGSTGKSKLVSLSHRQLLHACSGLKGHYHVRPNDRFHTNLNWSHPFGFIHGMLFPLFANAGCVIDHGLEAVEYVKFLTESKVTRLIGTPSSLQKVKAACGDEKRALPLLKSITVGVGSIPRALYNSFADMGIQVSQCYGQTENAWTLSMQNIDFDNDMFFWEPGAVGKGLPGVKYKVIDSQGDEVPGSGFRKGQLAVSGPTVMLKYVENEEETKKAIRGTWLYTGDLVEVDGEGDKMSMTLLGRKEDALIIKNKFVTLDALNSVFQSDALKDLVQDGAVFWVKNSQNKQVVVCVVVRLENRPLTDKDILKCFADSGNEDLIPVAVGFTDSIPKELCGRPNTWKLRRQFSSLGG